MCWVGAQETFSSSLQIFDYQSEELVGVYEGSTRYVRCSASKKTRAKEKKSWGEDKSNKELRYPAIE